MKIALITDGIAPYVIGGMQKHSFYLAKYFSKNKIHVDLIHYNNSSLDITLLECFSTEEKKYINSIVLQFPSSIKFPGHYVYNSYKYSCLAYDNIKNNLSQYTFIYTKGFTGWKLIEEKHKKNISCCPIGVKFHGYEMYQIAPEPKAKLQQCLLRPFVKKISKHADVVFSYGGKITEIIKSIGVQSNNIIEIPSGVEYENIASSIAKHQDGVTKFIFLGRAERRKGIVELNSALTDLITLKKDFLFEFIGPIPQELQINHPYIIYHGEVRDAKIILSILKKQDILVCPSWSEGFPNVILEAMACGLAIIGTDVGAVPALVSSKNGWLIKPADKEVLKNTMIEAISSTNLDSKKTHSLFLIQSQFNWASIYKKLITALNIF